MMLRRNQLTEHQASMMQRQREFWLQEHLCDVVLKSQDGTEHRCHRLVLSAASSALKVLLSEGFREGEQIRQGAAIEVAASSGALRAVVDYVYGGEPEVSIQDSLEILRLEDAYGLPQLVAELEAQMLESLDSSTAFQLLQDVSALGIALREACEDQIAGDFESCMQQASFLELSSTQLARFLKREDLCVTREESILEGLWRWLKASKDRAVNFGPMLQMVDFLSLSSANLERVRLFAQSLGPNGTDLQTEVDAAARKRKCLKDSTGVRPKRQRLTHWSAELGAHSGGVNVFLDGQINGPLNFCFHDGYIYIADVVADKGRIVRWKPDTEELQVVAGEGAPINGVNDLGSAVNVAVSLKGEAIVADFQNSRLVSFANGTGRVLVDMTEMARPHHVVFSPSGVLYVLGERQVWRLVDGALHAVVELNEATFTVHHLLDMAVSQDEQIYISTESSSILKFRPGDSEPTEVWKMDGEVGSVMGLSIVGDVVYAAFATKILAFRHGGRWAEVVDLEDFETDADCSTVDVLVEGASLYVLQCNDEDNGRVTRHPLPEPINLQADEEALSSPL